MLDVSVIIVNYNAFSMTQKCIDSVFEKTVDVAFEVIVVDNASTDESKEMFSKDTRIVYIYNEENLGFGQANNVGIKMAQGHNVLFLNPDTLIINNAIKILSDYLDANSLAGACGGNLLDVNEMPTHSFGRFFPSVFWEINALFKGLPQQIVYGKNVNYNYSDCVLEVAHIIGADLMVKKKVLEEVGCFNPLFFMYREETELCYRIKKGGYKIYSVPMARIVHLEGKCVEQLSSNVINEKKIKWRIESNQIFLSLCHRSCYVKLVNCIESVNIYFNLFISNFVRKQNKLYWKTVCRIHKELLGRRKHSE